MTMEPIDFLSAVAGYTRAGNTSSADRPILLATVDPAYSPFATPPYPDAPPPCRVTFDGETTLSGKYYAVANGVIPAPGQRVFMLPVGTTYMVAGVLNAQTAQGFYQIPDGTFSGVEFGEGNYWDSSAGLVLDTDAEVAGDFVLGGRSQGRGIIASAGSSSTSSATGATPIALLTMSAVTIESGRAYRIVCGGGALTSVGSSWLDSRIRAGGLAPSGTQWGEFYRFPCPTANRIYPAHGEIWVRRTAGTNLTTDVIMTGQCETGLVEHNAAAGRPRFVYIEDMGSASAYSWVPEV